jgi:ferredoxin
MDFEGKQFTLTAQESLLEALLRQGAAIPHSCRRGSCHTCVLKLEAGAVTLSREIDPALITAGCTLACVAHSTDAGLRVRKVLPDELGFSAELIGRRQLCDDIYALDLAPTRTLNYRAGQFVQLQGVDGEQRPY